MGVSHQLISLLADGVRTHRMIDGLLFVEWQIAIAALHRTAGDVNQIVHAMMATTFKNVAKTQQVALDVGRWVYQ
ncbi:hypothetical protein MITS9504_01948 [Synechococcus sp. MIT S9504]|nr:hypothetical protein MITS9504_01948 [Synechococcus sp. MIT S9504]